MTTNNADNLTSTLRDLQEAVELRKAVEAVNAERDGELMDTLADIPYCLRKFNDLARAFASFEEWDSKPLPTTDEMREILRKAFAYDHLKKAEAKREYAVYRDHYLVPASMGGFVSQRVIVSKHDSAEEAAVAAMGDIFRTLGPGDAENGGEGPLWNCTGTILDTLMEGKEYSYADMVWGIMPV